MVFVDECEYSEINGKKEVTRVQIESLDSKYQNFNLEEIWCEKCSSNDRRIDLFIDCIQVSESKQDLIRRQDDYYDKKYFIPLSVLRYMLKNAKILTQNHILMFLSTFVSENLNENFYDNSSKVSFIS